MIDFHAELVDGSHHTIHTHPLDFFLATPLALMKALEDAGTTLLEPIELARISVPEEYAGRIIGDLTAMRAVYDAPVIHNGIFTAEARIPVAEAMDYSVPACVQNSRQGCFVGAIRRLCALPAGNGKDGKAAGTGSA